MGEDEIAITDEYAWRAANPGLGTIKQWSYMREEVARVQGAPSDEPSFRAFDLNQSLSPTREMVCTPTDLQRCFTDDVTYEGPCYLAFDIGEAGSGSAAVAYFSVTGALRTWLAFGDVPNLKDRGKHDSADYLAMERRGELRTYPGRVVPVGAFVADVRADLVGAHIRGCIADGYKCAGAAGRLTVAVNHRSHGRGAGWLTGGSQFSTCGIDARNQAQRKPVARERDQGIDAPTWRYRYARHRPGALARPDRRAIRGGPSGRGGRHAPAIAPRLPRDRVAERVLPSRFGYPRRRPCSSSSAFRPGDKTLPDSAETHLSEYSIPVSVNRRST